MDPRDHGAHLAERVEGRGCLCWQVEFFSTGKQPFDEPIEFLPTDQCQLSKPVARGRNGDIVRGAFIIDAHDREIIASRAVVNAGISGSNIRDIMLEAVERRFGGHRAPSVIEMLSDNGSPYIAKDTQIFARHLGLKHCFTPVQSPQSNGISEAFVKRLKRDYVQVTPLPDAQAVLGLIETWIEDYNDNHPHSGLKMRSPREFIAAQTATA